MSDSISYTDDAVPGSRNVSHGSGGPDVAALQEYLGGLVVDGQFGPKTAARVRRYQRTRGMTVTGVVDGRIWLKILDTLPVIEPPTPPVVTPVVSTDAQTISTEKTKSAAPARKTTTVYPGAVQSATTQGKTEL